MPQHLVCPACHQTIQAADESAGGVVRCCYCGQQIHVPIAAATRSASPHMRDPRAQRVLRGARKERIVGEGISTGLRMLKSLVILLALIGLTIVGAVLFPPAAYLTFAMIVYFAAEDGLYNTVPHDSTRCMVAIGIAIGVTLIVALGMFVHAVALPR